MCDGLCCEELSSGPEDGSPKFQEYWVAPVELSVKVTVAGAQSPGPAVNAATGGGNTVTTKLCEILQPFTSVTVATYVVVMFGETVCDKPFGKLLFHVTVYGAVPPAGDAVMVVLLPPHTELTPANARDSGLGSVTVYVLVVLQPVASVTRQVYVPAHRPVAVLVVLTLGVHVYVKGALPLCGVTVSDPLQSPKQVASICCTEVVMLPLLPTVTTTVSGIPQEF